MRPAKALYPPEVDQRWRDLEWELIPEIPETPAMNVALDEVMTKAVGRGERGPTLRFWAWASQAVILGRFQSVKNEVQIENAATYDVSIVRRISGGGAMLVQPEGAITYSLYVPPEFVRDLSFAESYAFMDGWIVRALRDMGIDAWYQPLNDITSSEGKIGGAAQARRFGAVLHHTTMAYDMDVDLLMNVLRIGQEKLSDKGLTSAAKRVAPLRMQKNIPRTDIVETFTSSFIELTGATIGSVKPEERAEAEELVREKFTNPEWTYVLP
jgi:lipoate-protein ligase A